MDVKQRLMNKNTEHIFDISNTTLIITPCFNHILLVSVPVAKLYGYHQNGPILKKFRGGLVRLRLSPTRNFEAMISYIHT